MTNWTWEYIDEYMTLPRLESLTAYWDEHPPVHVLLAAFMGVKTKAKGKSDSWIARGLTVEEAIKEAQKPRPLPKNIGGFVSELSEMGVGFQLPKGV